MRVSYCRALALRNATTLSICIRRNKSEQAEYDVSKIIPKVSLWKPKETHSKIPAISDDLVRYLERTSLVEFSSEDSRRQLHESITFASQLLEVNTEGVEPLHSLLENEVLYLREDEVTEGNCKDDLLSLAVKHVEELYYLAPPGNVPLDQTQGQKSSRLKGESTDEEKT